MPCPRTWQKWGSNFKQKEKRRAKQFTAEWARASSRAGDPRRADGAAQVRRRPVGEGRRSALRLPGRLPAHYRTLLGSRIKPFFFFFFKPESTRYLASPSLPPLAPRLKIKWDGRGSASPDRGPRSRAPVTQNGERERPRGGRKGGKAGKGGHEEEGERGSRAENTGRKAKEGNVAGLEGGKIDEGRNRGGKGAVPEAEAPFSAAPCSLFLPPRFVWFCLRPVDRRQRISAASAASIPQRRRHRGPGPGPHALAGPRPRARLRCPRPPSANTSVPAPRRPALGVPRSPRGAQSPSMPPAGLALGTCRAGGGSPRRVDDRNQKSPANPVGRRRRAHAWGTEEGRPHTEPRSRGGHARPLHLRARRRGRPGPDPRALRGCVLRTPGPGCPTGARPLPAPGRTSKATARAGPRVGPQGRAGLRQPRGAGPRGATPRDFRCGRCLRAPSGLHSGAAGSGSGNRNSGFLPAPRPISSCGFRRMTGPRWERPTPRRYVSFAPLPFSSACTCPPLKITSEWPLGSRRPHPHVPEPPGPRHAGWRRARATRRGRGRCAPARARAAAESPRQRGLRGETPRAVRLCPALRRRQDRRLLLLRACLPAPCRGGVSWGWLSRPVEWGMWRWTLGVTAVGPEPLYVPDILGSASLVLPLEGNVSAPELH